MNKHYLEGNPLCVWGLTLYFKVSILYSVFANGHTQGESLKMCEG